MITNTHSVTCANCKARLVARPADGQDYAGRPVDAVASVVCGRVSLPALPELVWYTCPACDAWQRR